MSTQRLAAAAPRASVAVTRGPPETAVGGGQGALGAIPSPRTSRAGRAPRARTRGPTALPLPSSASFPTTPSPSPRGARAWLLRARPARGSHVQRTGERGARAGTLGPSQARRRAARRSRRRPPVARRAVGPRATSPATASTAGSPFGLRNEPAVNTLARASGACRSRRPSASGVA